MHLEPIPDVAAIVRLAAVAIGALCLVATTACRTPDVQASASPQLYQAMKNLTCVTREVALPKEYDHGSSAKQALRLTLVNVKKPVSDTSYRVFLNKPEATGATPAADDHCLGSLSFYGLASENDFVLDAGQTLDELRKDAGYKPSETVTITLVPVAGGEPIQLDELRLVIPN